MHAWLGEVRARGRCRFGWAVGRAGWSVGGDGMCMCMCMQDGWMDERAGGTAGKLVRARLRAVGRRIGIRVCAVGWVRSGVEWSGFCGRLGVVLVGSLVWTGLLVWSWVGRAVWVCGSAGDVRLGVGCGRGRGIRLCCHIPHTYQLYSRCTRRQSTRPPPFPLSNTIVLEKQNKVGPTYVWCIARTTTEIPTYTPP
jgi:hypothetical protein